MGNMIQENSNLQTKENVQGSIQNKIEVLKKRLLHSPVSGVNTTNEQGVKVAKETSKSIKQTTINVAAALKQRNNSK